MKIASGAETTELLESLTDMISGFRCLRCGGKLGFSVRTSGGGYVFLLCRNGYRCSFHIMRWYEPVMKGEQTNEEFIAMTIDRIRSDWARVVLLEIEK